MLYGSVGFQDTPFSRPVLPPGVFTIQVPRLAPGAPAGLGSVFSARPTLTANRGGGGCCHQCLQEEDPEAQAATSPAWGRKDHE